VAHKFRLKKWATYFSDIKAGRFQIAVMRWVGLFEPDMYRDSLSSSQFAPRGHNRGFYSNKTFDELVERARSEMNPQKRMELYTKAQKMIAHDLPILPLWYNANISILSPRIKNFKPATTGSFVPLAQAFKE
jgi:peptide/nickel transport system substrate-binding protein